MRPFRIRSRKAGTIMTRKTRRNAGLVALVPLAALVALALAALGPGEAQAQAPRTLTLDEAIQIALTRSPALRQAEAFRQRDAASEWEGWDRVLPSLSFSTGLNQSAVLQRTASDPITGGIVQLPDSLIQLRETFGTQSAISAQWTLFNGGRNLQALRRSRAEARAAELGFDAASVRIAASVTLAYLDALEAASLEDVLRAEARRAEELERTAVGRFEVGEVPEVDALQARLTAGDAELTLLEAEAATRSARLALLEYLQLPPDVEVALEEPSLPDPNALPAEEVLRERASERSAELASLQARLEAAERSYDGQRWWFLPSVSVGATWVRSEFGQTSDAITFSPRNEQTFYRLSFSWDPMERPGGIMAERRRTSAGVRVARAELDLQEAALVRGVEDALARLSRARTLQERSAVNLSLAERQREQAEERYRLGVAPLVERLNADAMAAEAARQAIVARYTSLRALAELERASGVRFLPSG
jgi:outer membrane protein